MNAQARRPIAAAMLLLLSLACPLRAGAAAPTTDLSLDVTPADHVVCRGMVNFDQAGTGSGAMLYVAPSFIGLLAEVAAHSALVAGSKSSQKQKIQEQADKVLEPYRALLSEIRVEALLEQARGFLGRRGLRVAAAGAQTSEAIRLAPVFFLTQDQRAFALEVPIEVPAQADGQGAWRNLVRVVGRPIEAEDPAKAWQDQHGEAMQREFSGLLVEAIAAALKAAALPDASSAGEAHTFRYPEGGSEHFERGTLLTADCERITLRTLRGTVFSVPHGRGSTWRPAECPATGSGPGRS